jgi:hypothetical protein
MFLPWCAVKAWFGRCFSKDTRPNAVRGFISGILGGIVGGLGTFTLIHHFSAIDASVGSAADVMSTANTYIVYAALLITAVAVFMTILAVIFTQHFSMEKERHLNHAYQDLCEILETAHDKKTSKIVEAIMKNPNITQYITEFVRQKMEEFYRDFKQDIADKALYNLTPDIAAQTEREIK